MSDLQALPRPQADAAGTDLSLELRRPAVDRNNEDRDIRGDDGSFSSGQPDAAAFPRSHLLRTIQRHPVATAAIVAAVVFVGPRTIGQWSLRGIDAVNRHATAIAPLLGQLARVSSRR